MGKNRIKTVTAGRLVTAVCYSQVTTADSKQERQKKTQISSMARQRINFRHAWQKLELEIAANFDRFDQYVTLTYDDAHLPDARDDAAKQMRKFLRRLQFHYKRQGDELRYIYITEDMEDEPGAPRRLHHHLIINARKKDYELILSLWGNGFIKTEDLLGSYRDSYEARARYMVKQRHPGEFGRKPGVRAWNRSRNLKGPEVNSELVSDNLTISGPPGAFILDSHEEHNEFGAYVFLKYLLPVQPTRSAIKNRRE